MRSFLLALVIAGCALDPTEDPGEVAQAVLPNCPYDSVILYDLENYKGHALCLNRVGRHNLRDYPRMPCGTGTCSWWYAVRSYKTGSHAGSFERLPQSTLDIFVHTPFGPGERALAVSWQIADTVFVNIDE